MPVGMIAVTAAIAVGVDAARCPCAWILLLIEAKPAILVETVTALRLRFDERLADLQPVRNPYFQAPSLGEHTYPVLQDSLGPEPGNVFQYMACVDDRKRVAAEG